MWKLEKFKQIELSTNFYYLSIHTFNKNQTNAHLCECDITHLHVEKMSLRIYLKEMNKK